MLSPTSVLAWFQWYPVRYIAQTIPRNAVVNLGFLMGEANYRLRSRRRTIAYDELRKTIPAGLTASDLTRIVRNGFRQACATGIETFCFPRMSPGNIDQWMRIHGVDYLRKALAAGNGVVIVLAHFGANQMVMAALGHRGYRINQIGSRPDDWHRLSGIRPSGIERRIFNLRLALEKSLPARFIYIDKSMRPVYQALQNNEIMILAADGRAGTRFIRIPVCERMMNVSAGPFRIAASTGAALIPVFPVRDDDGIHDLYIESPIIPESDNSPESQAESAARMYGERLSAWVRMKPDHYVMLMAEAAARSKIDTVPLFEDYRDAS